MLHARTCLISLMISGLAGLIHSDGMASPISFPAAVPLAYGAGTGCGTPLNGIINVPDSFTITDLNVRFLATHTWRTDTNLSLTSPDGTLVDLLSGPYGSNRNNYNVIFDDEAGVVVDTGAHDVNQLTTDPAVDVRSEGNPLSDFDGEDAQGDWVYSICDVFTGADDGNVLELTLIFDVPPIVDASKSVDTYPSGEYALPGSDIIFTFDVTNSGLGTVDDGSMVIIDTLPSDLEFYNGDMDDAGPLTSDPFAFAETGSGLTFTYSAVPASSDARYSDLTARPADMSECNYVPSAGYDAAVKHICVNPQGEFLAGDPDPNFTVSFRARIK